MLNIPGEDREKVLHYYNESHPYYKMDIAIVGAGNSAVDAALDTYRKGAKSVTMIIRETQIGENSKLGTCLLPQFITRHMPWFGR